MRVVLLRLEGVGIYVEQKQRAVIAKIHSYNAFLSGEFGGRIVDRDLTL